METWEDTIRNSTTMSYVEKYKTIKKLRSLQKEYDKALSSIRHKIKEHIDSMKAG